MKTASNTQKTSLKETLRRVRKNAKAMDAAEKLRGRFEHPAGLKSGDRVVTMIRRGEKMVKATGTFLHCNRNSTEYGVIKIGKGIVERALTKFEPAPAVALNSRKATARVVTK